MGAAAGWAVSGAVWAVSRPGLAGLQVGYGPRIGCGLKILA
jgi:hypothetical protein